MKHLTKVAGTLVCLCLLLFLANCQQDDQHNHSYSHDGSAIEYKHFNDIQGLPGLMDKSIPKQSVTARGGRDYYDFKIDSTKVMVADTKFGKFYTMAVMRDSIEPGVIENLIICDKDTVTEAYMATYLPAEEYLRDLEVNEHAPYVGGMSLTKLDQSRMTMRGEGIMECKYVTMSFCNYKYVHIAGPNCGSVFGQVPCRYVILYRSQHLSRP